MLNNLPTILRLQERIMKEGKGRGEEAPTHLIEHLKLTHAGRVTKNRTFAGRLSCQLNI